MTKVMQIVFCFPFPSTPNWHCRIEEEETLPPSFLRPLRTVSGEIRLARQKKGGDGFNPFSFRLTHHFYPITKGGLLSLRWESFQQPRLANTLTGRQKKEVGAAFPSPYSSVSPHQADKLLRKGRGGWLCGVGRKEDDGRRRRRRKSKNRTG